MKITLAAVTAITGLLVVESASAATHSYKATINGAQEVPAVTTAATGSADLTFDDMSKELYGKVTFTGLSGATTGQHIHNGALCGASSAKTIDLPNPKNQEILLKQGDIILTTADEANLVAGKMYVNIHTAANTGGEIRGQLFEDGIGTCPAGAADAGTDSGTSSSGGSSGTASSSGGSSSGGSSSGATTTRPDSGTENTAAAEDDSGCSTSGQSSSSSTNGVLVALGAAIAVTGIARGRRNKKK